MAKRKRLGILFSYQEKWVAGAYYVLNLVNALNTLPDSDKPVIVGCIETEADRSHLLSTKYPYLEFVFVNKPRNLLLRVVNHFLKKIVGKELFPYGLSPYCADAFFPFVPRPEVARIPVHKQIHWIPDFQDKRMPEFFPADELELRFTRNKSIAALSARAVFSSHDAEKDYRVFYPYQNTKNYVVHFAVTHPPTDKISEADIRKKFNLPANWFLAPNQFWKHKNQPVIIKALAALRAKNINIQVVFTGKEDDFRNPGYADEVKKLARDLGVYDQCRFLGFIDRAEQLWLMKNANAIIQPSLFEGWSTVVEDAKALEKFVLLSDIPVHHEQIKNGVLFFDPHSPESLAEVISQFAVYNKDLRYTDYQKDVRQFGENFIKVLES